MEWTPLQIWLSRLYIFLGLLVVSILVIADTVVIIFALK